MTNVTIADLPSILLPITEAETFLESEATEGGEQVSRRISVDQITGGGALSTLSDVTLTAPVTGGILYKSAGNWLDTDAIVVDPAGAITLKFNTAVRLSTTNPGVDVSGTRINLDSAADSNTDIAIINSQGSVLFSQRDSGGAGDFRILEGDASGVFVQDWVHFDKGFGSRWFHAGTERVATNSAGMDVIGTLLDLSAGADSNTAFEARNTVGGVSLGVNATSGIGTITQLDSTGAFEDAWITLTRNGEVKLFHNNVARIATTVDGGDILGGAAVTLLDVISTGDFTSTITTRNSIGGVQLRVQNSTGDARITQTTSGGSPEDVWLTMVRNGGVTLNHNNVAILATTAEGITANGNLSDFVESGASPLNIRMRNSEGGGRFSIDGDTFSIQQTDGAGAFEKQWIRLFADDRAEVYFNNSVAFQSASNGVEVLGSSGAGNAVITLIDNDSEQGLLFKSTTGGLNLRNTEHGGEVVLEAEDAGGTLRGGAIRVGTASSAIAIGFYNTAPIILQTGVAVSAAAIHAALVNLGLITA